MRRRVVQRFGNGLCFETPYVSGDLFYRRPKKEGDANRARSRSGRLFITRMSALFDIFSRIPLYSRARPPLEEIERKGEILATLICELSKSVKQGGLELLDASDRGRGD